MPRGSSKRQIDGVEEAIHDSTKGRARIQGDRIKVYIYTLGNRSSEEQRKQNIEIFQIYETDHADGRLQGSKSNETSGDEVKERDSNIHLPVSVEQSHDSGGFLELEQTLLDVTADPVEISPAEPSEHGRNVLLELSVGIPVTTEDSGCTEMRREIDGRIFDVLPSKLSP